jgi:hypothetical protein
MKFKLLNILIAVLLTGTAIYTIFVYIPNTRDEVVNTKVYAVVQSSEVMAKEKVYTNPLDEIFAIPQGESNIVNFELINREIPVHWNGKNISLKYTYLGEYSDSILEQLNALLGDEYKWQKQLDANGNIVMGGPIFIKDNIYQLHTHNGLSLANKHYLFGDLLGYLYWKGTLEGTEIKIGETPLQVVWIKDTKILEDSSAPGGAELIVSTCLERNGDRRLLVGFKVI